MLIAGIALLSLAAALGVCAGTGAFAGLSWLWIGPLSFLGSFLALGLIAFGVLVALCAAVDLRVPQERDSPFYRAVTYLYIDAVTTLVQMKVHTVGLEKVPKDGRFLLVCNHLNDMDPLTLLKYFKHSQLAFISKRENSSMFIIGKLMHKIMCQMMNRENDRDALKTILKCIDLLKTDQVSIAVFPEGYTSTDGLLHPFRSGVFKIATKAQVPIVVCTLQNTQHVFHNALRLRPTHVELHLLEVIPPEALKGRTAVDIGNYVHDLMAADLGPDKVLQDSESL